MEKLENELELRVPRAGLAVASCGNYILAMGGYAKDSYSDEVDIFKVTDNDIEYIRDHGLKLSKPRGGLVVASCGNYILAMGGYDCGTPFNTVDVFKVTGSGVEKVEDHGLKLSEARSNLAATSCGDYILVMGGCGKGQSSSSTIDIFKVTDNGIEKIIARELKLSTARYNLSAASCGDYILALGGENVRRTCYDYLYEGESVYSNEIDKFKIPAGK